MRRLDRIRSRIAGGVAAVVLAAAAPALGQATPGEDPIPIPPPGDKPQNFLKKPFKGDRKFLFYRVAYPGTPAIPLTGPTGNLEVGEFKLIMEETFEMNAYGTLDLTVDVTEVLTMPQPMCFYDSGSTSNMVRALHDLRAVALAAGWDYTQYDQEIMITDKFWASGPQGPGGFNKNFRVSFVTDNGLNLVDLIYHEIGHGLKFEHADFWSGGTSLPPSGTLTAYGDEYDPMGRVRNITNNLLPHFNPRHKVWMRWIGGARVPVIKADGVYTIDKIESQATTGLKGIRVRKDALHTYWVFYRGDDPVAENECIGDACNGALVTRARESNLRPSGDTWLVNVNPAVPPAEKNWQNAILQAGQEFYDADAQATIEVEAVRANDIDVRVTFDAGANPAGIDKPPILDILSPTPGEVLSGSVVVDITAYDPDVARLNFAGIDRVDVGIPQETGGFNPGATLTAAGQTWTLDTTQLTDGAHEFHVAAYNYPTQTEPSQVIRFRFLVCNQNCPPGPGGSCEGD